jgi:UDP:flavonoid glycosyltransferase YjiC (YdhE family)
MVPLGWALRAAGHQVFVASAPEAGLTVDDVASTGLTAVSVGDVVNMGQVAQEEAPNSAPVPSVDEADRTLYRKPVQADYSRCDSLAELEQMVRVNQRSFCPESMVDELIGFARTWQPDLVIWDLLMMFAGPLVARSCGAASARFVYCPDSVAQLCSAFRERYSRPDPIESALRTKFEESGWDFHDQIPYGDWTINCMPPWTWRPASRHYLGMRPLSFNGPSAVPKWLHERPTRRRVCITLGLTSQGIHSSVPPIDNLFKAVSGLDIEVIATLKRDQIADLPSIPDNIRVTEFVPMNTLLATCSAIVHHGGAGTVFSALEHGVPQIILPSTFANEKFWGQVAHASALEEQGAGIYVDEGRPVTADELREHLVRILEEPSFSQNASRLHAELLEMPTPGDIVPTLGTLTTEYHAPV